LRSDEVDDLEVDENVFVKNCWFLVVTSTLMAEDFFTAEIRENITSLSPLIVTMNQQFMTL